MFEALGDDGLVSESFDIVEVPRLKAPRLRNSFPWHQAPGRTLIGPFSLYILFHPQKIIVIMEDRAGDPWWSRYKMLSY